MWTVYWSRSRLDDERSWESDTGISTETKALAVSKTMLAKGWVVYAIFRKRASIWNEARITERLGRPSFVPADPLLESQQ